MSNDDPKDEVQRGFDPRNVNAPRGQLTPDNTNPNAVQTSPASSVVSPNEPPGSNVLPDQPPTHPYPGGERLTDAELHKLTRAELDEVAASRGVDISDASNKDDVIEALKKDARKRK